MQLEIFAGKSLLLKKVRYSFRGEDILRSIHSNRIMALKGSNFYQLVHHNDVNIIQKMHSEVLQLGASKSQFYRLIKSDCSSTIYAEVIFISAFALVIFISFDLNCFKMSPQFLLFPSLLQHCSHCLVTNH